MIEPSTFGQWAIDSHKETNHFYDTNLPYSYHLSLARNEGERFKHLLTPFQWYWVCDGIWGHDTIEDARRSYSDVIKAARLAGHTEANVVKIAEAIRAVTNYGRGRDRDERMPDYIYDEIRTTEGATYIKLMDRIANVKHGLISGSTMKRKYLKEQPHFKKMLYTEEYKEIWDYLYKLLNLEI
jgi:hypothetical protein